MSAYSLKWHILVRLHRLPGKIAELADLALATGSTEADVRAAIALILLDGGAPVISINEGASPVTVEIIDKASDFVVPSGEGVTEDVRLYAQTIVDRFLVSENPDELAAFRSALAARGVDRNRALAGAHIAGAVVAGLAANADSDSRSELLLAAADALAAVADIL